MKPSTTTVLASILLAGCGATSFAYTKPNTYRESGDAIVFKEQYLNSPHSWTIVQAIELLRTDGFETEANLAQKHLLPMLEGVTFNDVWGDADLAGGSVLDYYVPDPEGTGTHNGFGCAATFGIFAYKNCTESFALHPFYGYGNAAEHAQFRYDYAKRIYLGHWGDDPRDKMAGWVVDRSYASGGGQEDPQNGRWAEGTAQIDAQTRFGARQTPASALLDLLTWHTRSQVVFPDQTEDALSRIYVPKKEVFDQAPEWLDEHFGDADDIQAYSGYDGHGFAWYASWTLDAGGHCNGGADCAAPMVVRLPVGSKAHAFFQLGWAIHLLEDNTTPVHTTSDSYTTREVHNDVEREADAVLNLPVAVTAGVVRDLLPALTLDRFNALYDWPPPSCTNSVNPDSGLHFCLPTNYPTSDCTRGALYPGDFYKSRWYTDTLVGLPADRPGQVAWAYTRASAEIAHRFMPYIDCINTENNANWSSMGFFTALGLDNAIKSTAGLIRQFIEDIDKTAPLVTSYEPVSQIYLRSQTLTLNYGATDDESGVKALSATLDGQATLLGHDVVNGLSINLLTDLLPGAHTLTVTAVDNAGNTASVPVTFSIIVTAQSIIDDVTYFFSHGAITQDEATSLFKKLKAAAAYRAAGDCKDASGAYQAFIRELIAQSGKKVTPTAATAMTIDAQYLIAHCP